MFKTTSTHNKMSGTNKEAASKKSLKPESVTVIAEAPTGEKMSSILPENQKQGKCIYTEIGKKNDGKWIK